MRRSSGRLWALTFAGALGLSTVASAQVNEGFETGLPTTAPSSATNYTLGSGTWTILKGVRSTTKQAGTYGLALNSGSAPSAYADTPTFSGVSAITFWARGSGSSTLRVQKSVGGGAFTDVATRAITSSFASYTVAVNEAGSVRLRIQNGTSQTHYVDTVSVATGGSATPTPTTPPTATPTTPPTATPTTRPTATPTNRPTATPTGRVTATPTTPPTATPTSRPTATPTNPPGGGGDTFYVSPSGNDANPGTQASPFYSVSQAVAVAGPGDVIYMRGGTFSYTVTINLASSGTAGAPIAIWAYPGELPVIDFSGMTYPNEEARSTMRGFYITGSYWHLRGLEIANAADNGIKIDGSHNTVERCVIHHCKDSGLQIGLGKTDVNPGDLAAHNLVLNCDSYRNFDQYTKGGNADGFACKLNAGPGNTFRGCRAWENSDDGWDLYMLDHGVVIENSWTWHNGDKALFPPMSSFSGNGNGFKLGGDNDHGAHVVRNCVAFDHKFAAGKGFDQNHHKTGVTIYNSTSWGNKYNFMFEEDPDDGTQHVFKNNVAFAHVNMVGEWSATSIQANNSWNQAVTPDAADFLSLAEALAKAPRNADGSLPVNDFARLVSGSDLIDKGVGVGLPYLGAAPDLGAFEKQ